MKESKEAERILAGRYKAPAARALGIVRRLQQAATDGDLDAADLRVQLVNHLIREGAEGLEVAATPEGVELHVGERGAPCAVRRVELTVDSAAVLRERHGIDVGPLGEPVPEGLSVRQPSTTVLAMAAGLDGKACLARAEQALDAFDYEAALGFLRLAVCRTRGAREALVALARFLVETYAYYDEAVELLTSPRVDASAPPLARMLADALLRAGRWAEALAGYERLVKGATDPAEVRRRAATCAVELGDVPVALAHLAEADRAEPGAAATAELRARVERAAEGALREALAGARAALEAGDPRKARTAAEAVRAQGLDGPELTRILREADARERAGQAAALIDKGRGLLAAGELRDGVATLRQASELRPDDAALAAEVAALDRSLVAADLAEHVERGSQAAANGDVVGAFRAFHRALTLGEEAGGLDEEGAHPLLRRLAALVRHERPKHIERAFEGLAALGRAEDALEKGLVDAALSAAEDAARLLRGFAPAEATVARARAAFDERLREKAAALLAAAADHEARGELEEAIARLDEVVTLCGADHARAGERRRALRESVDRDRRARELLGRVRKLIDERNGFRALQVLEQAAGEVGGRADAAALAEDARRAIEEQFPVRPRTITGPPPLPGAAPVFDAVRVGVGALGPKDVRVIADEEGDRILLLVGRLLVVLRADTLGVVAAVDLPETVPFGDEGDSLFTADVDGALHVLFVRNQERTLTRVVVGDGTARVAARVDLGAALGATGSTVRSFAYDAPSGNVLVLELSRRGAKQESRFMALDTTDGRIRFRETYNQPLFNLQPLRGAGRYTASRVVEGHARMMGSWYHLAVLDSRGKIQERVVLDGVDEEPYALKSTVCGPLSGRIFCEYWGVDPFTRQVRGSGGSLLVLHKDWRVFFQSADPDLILGGDRHAYGAVSLASDGGEERLLLSWREPSGRTGVAVVDATHLRCLGHVKMPEGVHVGAVRSDPVRGRARVVTFASGRPGFRVEPLDLSAAR